MPENSGKRQQIIETAYRLFKKEGFHATGIDRIIAEADVAKMTMYRHFPNKDGLIIAVLEYRMRRFEQQLDELEALTASPEKKIAQIFDWYNNWFQDADFHGCLFQHALAEFGNSDNPIFKAATAQKNKLKNRMYRILKTLMPPSPAKNIAATLLLLIEGATLLAQMGQGRTAIREAKRAMICLLHQQTGGT